jgi:hypothetical protein
MFSLYLEIYLQFFAILHNSYVFIPVFLTEPQTVFRGTLKFRGNQFEKLRAQYISCPVLTWILSSLGYYAA